ncbi:MAG: YitT family protein [Bacilli bacterium]|nr:YitT family protein [Bacilli bacterium]
MQNRRTFRRKVDDWMVDHIIAKRGLNLAWIIIVLTVSSLLFAIGYKTFLNPTNLVAEGGFRLVSGGASGIAQTFIEAIRLIGKGVTGDPNFAVNDDILYSIFYFAINVPVFLIAFFFVGKRFALLTLYAVAMVSVFTNILALPVFEQLIDTIAEFSGQNGGLITRAVFGGVLTGVSSGLAYRVDSSAGGMDVIAYAIALKKNVLVGKYTILINIMIVIAFTTLAAANDGFNERSLMQVTCMFFSAVYMLVTGMVVNLINLRNKKCEVEVVTDDEELGSVLIANLPHAATISRATGAYSGKEHFVVQMVISYYEVKQTVKIVRESDPKAFIKVIDLSQVYGRFFMRPIR